MSLAVADDEDWAWEIEQDEIFTVRHNKKYNLSMRRPSRLKDFWKDRLCELGMLLS